MHELSKLSDEELYGAILKKDQAAFHELYARHASPLFRFIYRFTLNRPTAEEILHDIFVQLLSGKFIMQPEAHLKSWLYTVAKNKSLNHLKRQAFEKVSTLDELVSSENFEEQFDFGRSLQKLNLLEAHLPADLRKTWNLRKQGLDYQQIAQELSIPVGTVKSRFSRLVDFFKKEFIK